MSRIDLFENTLAQSWPPADWADVSIVVAVSGGADSVALLAGLSALKQGGEGEIFVGHFNHGLRAKEADEDELHVRTLAKRFGLPLIVGHGKLARDSNAGDSLEATARNARYDFLLAAAETHGARYVVTAHTADDQAETILHRVLRGTGVAGLAGMPRVRPLSPMVALLRPLLHMRRETIVEYLRAVNLTYREDAMNRDLRFTRARLRHELLPNLRAEYNANVNDALLRLGQLAGECREVIDTLVEKLAATAATHRPLQVSFTTSQLRDSPPFLVRELLMHSWRTQHWPLQAMTHEHWSQLSEMLLTGGDAPPQTFPGNIRAEKHEEEFILLREENENNSQT